MSVKTPPAAQCATGGAIGLCALALLRKFEQWEAKAEADGPDCTFLNGSGWDDLGLLATQARALLTQMKVEPIDFRSLPQLSRTLGDNPAPKGKPLLRRLFSLSLGNQIVRNHADPVGKADEGGEHESQLDRVAAVSIRESDLDVSFTVEILADANLELPLGPDLDDGHSQSPSGFDISPKVAEAVERESRLHGRGQTDV